MLLSDGAGCSLMSACRGGVALIWRARYSASSLTQPSSAEPRVCCHGRPRKYRPGEAVTPRSCTRWLLASKTGAWIHEWSSPEAGGPDDAARFKLRAVAERHLGARDVEGPLAQVDAVAASGGAGA